MPFIADDLGAWLVGLLADAGRKKLVTLVLGDAQERALQQAATAAVLLAAEDLHPEAGDRAEELAMVIGEVFRDPRPLVPRVLLIAQAGLLEALRAGITEQLAVLDDPSRTGTGQSSAQVLGFPATTIAETLTGYLVGQIVVRGWRGAPLEPLAAQLNHDVTHMQGRRLEVLVGQLADDVRKALALRERESETLARLESVECAARAGYVTDRPEAPIGHIILGAILDDEDHRFFVVPAALLGQGVLISGANCTESSYSLEYILDALAESRIPWLVIESKEPYEILRRLPHLPSLTIIDNDLKSVPIKFNPLEVEAGFPLPVHLDMVRALFMATLGSASASFLYSLSAVLQEAYTRYGWHVLTGKTSQADPIFPELVNLKYANRYSRHNDEYEEIPAADEANLDALVQLLLSGQACSWLDLGYRVDMRKLLDAYVAVRIADVAPEAKGFLVGTLMLRIFERAKMAAREDASQRLRHVTVIKDASILLSDPVPPPRSASACRTLADTLAEMRHYGESIIIYEQSPAELMPTVMHKTGLKIIHRLSTRDDRNAISAVVNADERASSQLMTLRPGVAMVIAEGMDRPIEIQLAWARHGFTQ